MADRISCCVPFCQHTRGLHKDETSLPLEWICAKHWRPVTRKLRRLKSRTEAAYIAAKIKCEAIEIEGMECAKLHQGGVERSIIDRFAEAADRLERKGAQATRAWERCKRAAIEAAGGIG